MQTFLTQNFHSQLVGLVYMVRLVVGKIDSTLTNSNQDAEASAYHLAIKERLESENTDFNNKAGASIAFVRHSRSPILPTLVIA